MLIDFAITESNRSQNAPEEVAQDRRILNDTEDADNIHSRAPTTRPTMDSQFATLIDILRHPLFPNHELTPSDAISTTLSHHSQDSDSSAIPVAPTLHSSRTYSHPCLLGGIIDHPASHRNWQEEDEFNWMGEESSVSSSFTNGSSDTSRSTTACISSSSFELSPGERDRPLTISEMSPLRRSLSLTYLMEICSPPMRR